MFKHTNTYGYIIHFVKCNSCHFEVHFKILKFELDIQNKLLILKFKQNEKNDF